MEDQAVQFINTLIGKKLIHFCCEAEILDFYFAPLVLHAMGFSRVIKNNDILVTISDYQSWDEVESTNNDEWYNMKKYNEEIVGGSVVTVELNAWNDLRIALDNGVIIECLIANAYPHYEEELEQWVLFEEKEDEKEDQDRKFLFVYNKGVDFFYSENRISESEET